MWWWPFKSKPALEVKDSRTAGVVVQTVLGRPVWTPRDYLKLAREGYQQNVIAYAAISKIAEAVASLPVYVQRKAGDDWEDIEHPVMDVLDSPNPGMDGDAFMRALVTYYEIAGNAYVEKAEALGLVELYPHRPDRVKVIPGKNALPIAYEYSTGGSTVRLTAEEMLHIREPNPVDDWYGMSRFDPAAFSIDAHTGSGALAKAVIDNGARPSGALKYTGPEAAMTMTAEQKMELREEIRNIYSGAKNAGRPLVLDGGLDWVPMSMNFKDMEFGEGKNQAAREIALAFNVPPLILGINGDNTFANYAEANRAFYRDRVIPSARRMYKALGRFLFGPDYRTHRIVIDEDDVSALAPERAERMTAVQGADFLSINEKRQAFGYEDRDDGEVVLVGSGMVPLEDAGLPLDELMSGNDEEGTSEEGDSPSPPDAGNGEAASEGLGDDPDEDGEGGNASRASRSGQG